MEMRRLASLVIWLGALRNSKMLCAPAAPQRNERRRQSAPDSGRYKADARSATSVAQAGASASPVDELPATSEIPVATTPSGSLIDKIKSELEKQKRRLLIAALDAACRVELEGDELSIEFLPEARHARDTLAKADNAKALREACAEACGREIGIRFAIRQAETDEGAPTSPEEEERRSKQQVRETVAQNPTVQQVLRAFGGEIVDITSQ
jgi:hypothetical protein